MSSLSRLLLPLVGAGLALLATASPGEASACSSGYLAQLRQVQSQLEAGGPASAAVDQLQAIASADGAASALDPVIADLQGGEVAAAERLLGTTVATLQPPAGSGCGAETGAERQALSGVYRSPAFAQLDQPSSPNWAQQAVNAVENFVGGLVRTLGPAGAGALAAVLLGIVVALAGWRVRQVIASGREPRVAAEESPAGSDPEAEWASALAASEAGDFRAAVRHAFRSALVTLARRGRLAVHPAWTTPELLTHAGGDPELSMRLAPAAAGFDRAWYSEAPVDQARWEEVRGHCQAIRALSGSRRPSV